MSIHQTTPSLIVDTQDFFSTTLSAQMNNTDTVCQLNAAPTNTEGILVIDPNNIATREIIYFNSKSGTNVTCPDNTSGSGRGLGGTSVQTHASGTLVEMRLTAEHLQELANGNANQGQQKHIQIINPNYIVSGFTLTSTSGLAITLSSGVAYINGKRFSYGGGSFTGVASNDSYFDVKENGDGTITVVQQNVTNNTVSPAISTNSDSSAALRIGIVCMGSSALTAGGINQGQPTAVLPIVSSVAYSVTDGLGNLIYPTSANPRVIGYRQIVGSWATTNSTATAITGLSAPAIVPAGRQVVVSVHAPQVSPSGTINCQIGIWSGTVGSGTQLQDAILTIGSGSYGVITPISPSQQVSGLQTYNAAGTSSGGNTLNVYGTATAPTFIKVELV